MISNNEQLYAVFVVVEVVAKISLNFKNIGLYMMK